MKCKKVKLLLFAAIAVLCIGCGKEKAQESDQQTDSGAGRQSRVSFTEDKESEIPEHIYKVYAEKAEIEADKLLQELIPDYKSLKSQAEEKKGAEGTKYTLTAEEISYEWMINQNNFIFQRLSGTPGRLPEESRAQKDSSRLLEKMGFQAVEHPKVQRKEEDGTEYYDLIYQFLYQDMKILWDLSFESPSDPWAEVGIAGEELMVSYDAQGIRAFHVYGLRKLGDRKETVASEKVISVQKAVKLFEDYAKGFQEGIGLEEDSTVISGYTLEQAELIYIPMPDQETGKEIMIPAWYLKLDSREEYKKGTQEQIVQTEKEVLIDALTGYIYKAD